MATEENSLQARIEAIAEAAILVEPTDLQTLTGMHTHFEEIARQAAADSLAPVVAEAARAAAGIIEKITLEEAPDPAAALRVVTRTICALQEIVRDGQAADRVSFPPELGVGQGQADNKTGDESRGAAPDSGTAEADRESAAPGGSLEVPAFLPSNVDPRMFSDFLARQDSVLEDMAEKILSLEKLEDTDNLQALQRLLHTLKGEAAILGMRDIEKVCHATEDALGLSAPNDLIDSLLQMKDWLGQVFHACSGKGPMPQSIRQILAALPDSAPQENVPASAETRPDKVDPAAPPQPGAASGAEQDAPSSASQPASPAASAAGAGASQADLPLLQDFVCEANEHLEGADVHLLTLETDPQDMEAINAVFRAFHTIKAVAGCLGLDQLRALSHEAENLLDKVRKGEMVMAGPPIDAAFDAVDALRRLVRGVRESLETGRPMLADPVLPALLTRIAGLVAGEDVPAGD